MFCFTFVSDHKTDSLMLYSVQLKNMYSYPNSSLKLSDIVRGLSCQQSYYNCCLVMVERLFLAVPLGCLQFVIVVFPDHTHLLFLLSLLYKVIIIIPFILSYKF